LLTWAARGEGQARREVRRFKSGHCFGAAIIAEAAPLAIAIATRQPGE
jgi:hypothetical protein